MANALVKWLQKALPSMASAVPTVPGGGLWRTIWESFPGAWQRNVEIDSQADILSFSGVFSPLTLIAGDISKCRVKLMVEHEQYPEIYVEVKRDKSPLMAVLRKPNPWQDRIKFMEQWILSKLMYGNTYVLKGRDKRGVVNRLYVLDAQRVTPLVTESGDVYYQLSRDDLSRIEEQIVVPASEIIHDRMYCLWHPLVGVSPIYACALSATMGRKIQTNSTKFFDNMSRPSGMLTGPGTIQDETAERLKRAWNENFSGANIGKLAVLGDGLKYEPMTIPAEQAQLQEQLDWTVKDSAACFHMPLFKVGGPIPVGSSIDTLNQVYYSDCLQGLFESAELCLDEGLELPPEYYTEFDLDGLLRMDQTAMVLAEKELVGASIKAPNESRHRLNLPPKKGGDSLMMQQQNYSLEALAKRDEKPDPFGGTTPAIPAPAPAPALPAPAPAKKEEDEETLAVIMEVLRGGLEVEESAL